MSSPTKAEEWRRFWPLPCVALLGMAGSGMVVYSTGVFMGALTQEFGWSKTQYTSSMTMQLLMSLLLIPAVGRAVDRFGARSVALAGIIPAVLATALLGLANGALWQWWLLNGIQTLGVVIVIPPVWITAVVGQFHASRGLALAVALAGIGVGTAVWPMLAALYIDLFGWRLAYGAIALSWGVLIAPLTLLFFYGPHDRLAGGDKPPRRTIAYGHQLRSRTFLCLAVAGGLFVLFSQSMTLHLVPILRERGLSLAMAAGMAGVAGMASIAGRLGMGLLLDILPARKLGIVVFLLPVGAALMLGFGPASTALALAAAALLGLSMGAEGDVLNYIASRRFDHAIFGSIAAILQTVMAVAAVGGVMIAGSLTDIWGSYELFLMVGIPVIVLGALTLSLVPDEPRDRATERDHAKTGAGRIGEMAAEDG